MLKDFSIADIRAYGSVMTWAGIMLGAAVLWGGIFSFAYWRRRFGGSIRSYARAAFLTWLGTVGILLVMSIFER